MSQGSSGSWTFSSQRPQLPRAKVRARADARRAARARPTKRKVPTTATGRTTSSAPETAATTAAKIIVCTGQGAGVLPVLAPRLPAAAIRRGGAEPKQQHVLDDEEQIPDEHGRLVIEAPRVPRSAATGRAAAPRRPRPSRAHAAEAKPDGNQQLADRKDCRRDLAGRTRSNRRATRRRCPPSAARNCCPSVCRNE